jgi:hypothetical protein
MLLDGLIKEHNVDYIYIYIYRVASRKALHLKL